MVSLPIEAAAASNLGLSSFGLSQTRYINPSAEASDADHTSFNFTLQSKQSFKSDWLSAGGSVDLLVYAKGPAQLSMDAPELYLATGTQVEPVRLSVGRRKFEWSLLDDTWGLGVWQPLFRRDYVAPIQSGLAGFFLEAEVRPSALGGMPISMTLFGSPLFLPERGIPFEARNGTFVSQSRWFTNPPSQVDVLGMPTGVRYRLNLPSVQNIVAHPGGGALFRIGNREGFWASAAWAWTPINRLLLSYDGYLQVGTPNQVVAELYPRVTYHQISSLQAGTRTGRMALLGGGRLEATMSLLSERPVGDSAPLGYTRQQVSNALSLSPSVAWAHRRGRIDLSWLKRWGGNEADQGPFATPGQSSFEVRYPYENAVKIAGDWKIFPKLGTQVSMLYDIPTEGTLLSADVGWEVAKNLTVGFGMDLIGSGIDPMSADATGNYLSRYRANDRWRGGMTYAF